MQLALELSRDRVLVEYSQGIMNPRVSKGKDNWNANIWGGKVDADTCKKGAGYNVMGQFVMRVRRVLISSALPADVWPQQLP